MLRCVLSVATSEGSQRPGRMSLKEAFSDVLRKLLGRSAVRKQIIIVLPTGYHLIEY